MFLLKYTHLDNKIIKGSKTVEFQGLFSRAIGLLLMSSNSIGTGNHQRAYVNPFPAKGFPIDE